MAEQTRFLSRTGTTLVLLAGILGGLLSSTTAFAQANPVDATRRREGLGIGVVWTNQTTSKSDVGKFVSLRVSVPAGNHAGFDFDLGFLLGGKHTLPRGRALTAGTRVRWLPKARGESGVTGYLFGGVRLVRGTTQDVDGQRRSYVSGVVDGLGLGVDFLNAGGVRGGFEVGQSHGFRNGQAEQRNVEPIAAFTSFFVGGGRK